MPARACNRTGRVPNPGRMNVARKSTTKLPQAYVKSRPLSTDSTPDSGVLSLESGDSSDAKDTFQEALMNLKALNGEVQEEGCVAPTVADPKVAAKASNGIVSTRSPLLAKGDAPSSPETKCSALEGSLPAPPVQDGKLSPTCRSQESAGQSSDPDAKSLSSSSLVGKESASKVTEQGETGQSFDIKNKMRNSVHELMSQLSKENGAEFKNFLERSKNSENKDSSQVQPPLVRKEKEKFPKSQKGNLFENLTELDTSDRVILKEGRCSPPANTKAEWGSSEATSAEGTPVVPLSSKCKTDTEKSDGAKDAQQVSSSIGSSPLGSERTEASSSCVAKDPADKEDTPKVVMQISDKCKNEPCPMDESDGAEVDNISSSSKSKTHKGDTDLQSTADPNSKEVTEKATRRDSSESKKDSNEKEESVNNSINETTENSQDLTATEKPSEDPKTKEEGSSAESRKRSSDKTDDGDDQSLAPKRSRLGDVIGKLASKIGVAPETVPEDVLVQDEESESEESMADSDSAEVKSEEYISLEDEKWGVEGSDDQPKLLITSEELEELIRGKVQEYMKKHRDEEMAVLEAKLDKALANNDKYRKECKDLHRQVLDLTVVQQHLEKRKAATTALRSISTKNVALQVDLGLVKGSSSPKQQKMTLVLPGTSGTSTSMIGSAPVSVVPIQPLQTVPSLRTSAILTSPPQQPQILPAVRGLPPSSMVTLTNQTIMQGSPLRQLLPPANPLGTSTTASAVKNILDGKSPLITTAVMDRRLLSSAVASPTLAPKTVTTVARTVASGSLAAKGIIDLTDDDDGKSQPTSSATRPVQIAPISSVRPSIVPSGGIYRPMAGGTPIILSPNPPGTQLASGSMAMPRPGVLQVVALTSANQTLRPGSLLTVMPQTAVRTTSANVHSNMRLSVPQAPLAAKPSVASTRGVVPTIPALATRPVVTSEQIPVRVVPSTTSHSSSPVIKHPAPLPATPQNMITVTGKTKPPPQPSLKISRVSQGIVLSWNMTLSDSHAEIKSYQLFAYQETNSPPSTSLWKKVGDVNALPLPMACTLTQFQEGNKYHFAVRAQDVYMRLGDFSDPSAIHLTPK